MDFGTIIIYIGLVSVGVLLKNIYDDIKEYLYQQKKFVKPIKEILKIDTNYFIYIQRMNESIYIKIGLNNYLIIDIGNQELSIWSDETYKKILCYGSIHKNKYYFELYYKIYNHFKSEIESDITNININGVFYSKKKFDKIQEDVRESLSNFIDKENLGITENIFIYSIDKILDKINISGIDS